MPTPESSPVVIAVVGAACRLPGGINSPAAFWRVLDAARDVVGEVPPARWDVDRFHHPERGRPGRIYTRAGGFLDDVRGFDAGFFHISPREAAQIDPQQRLLLELAWEALEDAGVPAARMRGSATGVFVGISSNDYSALQWPAPEAVTAYTNTGGALSIASNRLSYVFDLRGPSFSVDTACSSGLVALHLACESLRRGESRAALVGGVNLLLGPFPSVGFAAASMLSPTGRCHTFDAAADGYVRSEGGVVLLLKPLADAERDGDRVLGVIAGTGVNSDGRTGGLSFPSEDAQAALLREVYASAGIRADQVVAVEAHGTGTQAGDPVECRAIGRVLGAARSAGPLPLGSAKTNVGHLEPAAGLVGVLKALLALQHRRWPGVVHLATPNPAIPFDDLGLRVSPDAIDLSPGDGPMVIGVNAFGFGGTNAHAAVMAVDEAGVPPAQASDPSNAPPRALLLSAPDDEGLKAVAARYASFLADETAAAWPSICATAAHHREPLPQRLVLLAGDREAAAAALARWADGEASPEVVTGRAGDSLDSVALVFSGNGSQWWGMGRGLVAADAAARRAFAAAAECFRDLGGPDLDVVLRADEAEGWMARTDVAQPALFAVQAAIVAALTARGLRYDVTFGHSVGELAAAWAAGILTLEQAALVTLHRSRLQHTTAGRGGMAAAALSAEEAVAALAPFDGRVELAAINSPGAVTLAGDVDALDAIGARLAAEGRFFRRLDLDYAFHSVTMDPIRAELIDALAGVEPGPGHCRFVSTVLGEEIDGAELDADYWWRNVRQPVRFARATEYVARTGTRAFVEVGPHPVLRVYLDESLRATGVDGHCLATLRRGGDEAGAPDRTIAALVTAGAAVDLARWMPRAARCALPTYPWQRTPYWFEAPASSDAIADGPIEHPWLGRRARVAQPTWRHAVDHATPEGVADHVVGGAVVFPAAGYVEMMLAAASRAGLGAGLELEHVQVTRALPIPPGATLDVETTFDDTDGVVAVRSRGGDEAEWTTHATARASASGATPDLGRLDVPALTAALPAGPGPGAFYAEAVARGLAYGPAFQRVSATWVGAGVVVAALDEAAAPDARVLLAPPVLDAALQTMVALLPSLHGADDRSVYLPTGIARLRCGDTDAPVRFVETRLVHRGERSLAFDIRLAAADGRVLATLSGARARRITLVRGASAAAQYIDEDVVVGGRALLPGRALVRRPEVIQAPAAARGDTQRRRLDDLCGVYAAHALGELAPGGVDEAALTQAGVVPEHRGLSSRLIEMCVDDGWLRPAGEGRWQWNGPVDDASARWRALLADAPDLLGELLLAARIGERLAAVLRGDADLDTLLLDDGGAVIDQIEDASPLVAPVFDAVCALVAATFGERRGAAGARVVEIGARTGALSGRLAACLAEVNASLVVLHERDAWRSLAETRTAGRAVVEHRVVTRGQPLTEQGLQAGRADLVVAHAHSADDLRQAAAMADTLLTPGGVLIACAWSGDRLTRIVRSDDAAGAAPLDVDALDLSPLHAARRVAAGPGWAVVDAVKAGTPETAHAPAIAPRRIAVTSIGGADALADEVSAACARRGHDVTRLDVTAAAGLPATDDVILVSHDDDASGDGVAAAAIRARDVVDALGERWSGRAWLVTAGARPPAEALGGFWRVLMNERAPRDLRAAHLDAPTTEAADDVAAWIDAPGEEREVERRGPSWIATRVTRREPPPPLAPAGAPFVAAIRTVGDLDSVRFVAQAPPAAGPGQVAVEVRASALNFHDLMWANGLLPEEAVAHGFVGATLGMEFAGVVTAVGDGVTGFAPGDRVMGFAPASLASHVATPAGLAGHIPEGMSFEEAATLPSVCFTVLYALEYQARLGEGEALLVHSAAGGVGLAAIQLARHLGVRVIATAGTAEKRALLHRLGVDDVFDSRRLDFDDRVREACGGVDAVLNSLAGDAIPRGIGLLRPFGRFLELGKRDFYANSRVGLRAFADNLTFHGIDVDQLLSERPGLTFRLFARMMALIRDGVFRALPYRAYPLSRLVDALRAMQRGRHVGKIVLTMDAPPVELGAAPRLDPAGAVVVTGGLAGFGLATAEWLVRQGARRLVLMGRRGAATPGADEAMAALRAAGAEVDAVAVDVTDRPALAGALDRIRAAGPIGGVVHAATAFDDGVAAGLTEGALGAAMAAKLRGAWLLHTLTEGDDLDVFLLHSSVTTTFGNPGQAAYVAANAYLEGLAALRRGQGRPATVVRWGAIADAGVLARETALRDRLAERHGVAAVGHAEALAAIEPWWRDEARPVTVAALAWPALLASVAYGAAPRFDRVRDTAAVTDAGSQADWVARAAALGPDGTAAALEPVIREEVSRVLRLGADRVDAEAPLASLGMDSLMVVELQTALDVRHGVDVPAMQMMPLGTRAIARVAAGRLIERAGAVESPEDWVDELTDEDVSALLDELGAGTEA